MSEPVKIIWKYKNNHRRIQYNTYIFIGSVDDTIMKILNKIADLTLYNALSQLTKNEYAKLEEKYGTLWYQKFFNMYHIHYTINLIRESNAQKKDLIDKYGNDWYDSHINKHKIMSDKLLYNYETVLKDILNKRVTHSNRSNAGTDDLIKDFRTYKPSDGDIKITLTAKNNRYSLGNILKGVSDDAEKDADNSQLNGGYINTKKCTNCGTKMSKPNMNLSVDSHENINKHLRNCSGCSKIMMCESCGNAVKCNDKNYKSKFIKTMPRKKIIHQDDLSIEESLSGGNDSDEDDRDDDALESDQEEQQYNEENTEENMPDDLSIEEPLSGGNGGNEDDIEENDIDDSALDTEISNMEEDIDVNSDDSKYSTEIEIDMDMDKDSDEIIMGTDVDNKNIDSTKNLSEEDEMKLIEEMYKESADDNAATTTNLIKKALHDENYFNKKEHKAKEFDISRDNNLYDEKLRNVWKKIYIIAQYIYKDDSIETIKEKICCSIKNSSKFDKNAYVLPSRQYLWSEYYYNNKIEKIMIGQKWTKRNELLNVDIEPNTNIRYYEELMGNLKLLRDNIKRFGNRITFEDDSTNILEDYGEYVTNNDIYMIDIYNELGLGFKADGEVFKNIYEVYIKLYFYKIKSDDLKNIIDYLNGNKKLEQDKIEQIHTTINNDLAVTNEIMSTVNELFENKTDYKKMFGKNFVTHSVVHVPLRLLDGQIDLYRIFNSFENNEEYPFMQYQTLDGTVYFKFKESEAVKYIKNKDKENSEIFAKWFENSPYGISFKVKIIENNIEKFTSINLKENGQIEYKTQWKESDGATMDDIKNTYQYVGKLIEKINKETDRIKIDIPHDFEYKYAFINTIQKFDLPEKYSVNHNDLSEFSRYFYPYVSLIIEPRKRHARIQKGENKSKFGTYLRYKRVSKYDTQIKLEQRIIYFMRNYEYNDKSLADEIAKQFNITEERAIDEIKKVKQKYNNIKLSRKILKKLENIPKYKLPGIGIEIQGKQRENYKLRISGARDQVQLDKITEFINILIYLYVETYLYKKPERQKLKNKLIELTHIAKRRNKVEEIMEHETETKIVKQMTKIDKQRIGFKPEKGQNQWTRSCQNSGEDKKRQPLQFNHVDELLKHGFSFNKKSGEFEKKVIIKNKGKKTETTIRSIKLQKYDSAGNPSGSDIYYACGPEENGEHIYVGFLTRSSNPNGMCMPCCFKKDPAVSNNASKKAFHEKCLQQQGNNDMQVETLKPQQKAAVDKLYILQDTNKIQEGRFGFMSKYMDFFFNGMLDKTKKIKHHYLIKSSTGYFFKYGSKQDNDQFANAVSSIFDLTLDELKQKIFNALENDKNDLIFTSLNNGDIKTQFETKEKYINYLQSSPVIDYNIINSIISIPNVITKHGINIIIFQKKTIIIKKALEKEKIKEDFFLLCQNTENNETITNPLRHTIFLIKENKNYYPIVLVIKPNELSKTMNIVKSFHWENTDQNIVHHIYDLYKRNCSGGFFDEIVTGDVALTAWNAYNMLKKINKSDYVPKWQVIDIRNKCIFIITANETIVPVKPSGSIYNLPISRTIEKYIDTFDNTLLKINKLYTESNKQLRIKPKGVYHDEHKGDKYRVIAIITKSNNNIPIIAEFIKKSFLDKNKIQIENKPLYDKLDRDIAKGKDFYQLDERIKQVNYNKYKMEGYELFRLNFSAYINNPKNTVLKKKITDIIDTKDGQSKEVHVDNLKLLLYDVFDSELYAKFKKLLHNNKDNKDNKSAKYDKFVDIITKNPDLSKFNVPNIRTVCSSIKTNKSCDNIYCNWNGRINACVMQLPKTILIYYVNKISEELVQNDMKAWEILRQNNYYVSDIVDKTRFTQKNDQRIISSNTIKKIITDIFSKDTAPSIGKKNIKNSETNYLQINANNPVQTIGNFYIQNIIKKNITLFRAYVNGFYWKYHPYYDNDSRNLGFFSPIQTDLANYFRSIVLDWLNDKHNIDIIEKELVSYLDTNKDTSDVIKTFALKLGSDIFIMTNCIFELFVLNKLQEIPVIVYDDNMNELYIFDDGIAYHHILKNKTKKTYDSSDCISIKITTISQNDVAENIAAIYPASK